MIVHYVSAHGLGHAVRSCNVLRALPPDLPVTICTRAPAWLFERELAGRAITLRPAAFDVGTLGPDSVAVDLAMTVDAAEQMADAADAKLEEEAAFLREVGAKVVVSDIPPMPLAAARRAGIPSILIANFTWPAIYAYLVGENTPPALRARAEALIARLQGQVDQAGLLLEVEMAIPMPFAGPRRRLPLVARSCRPRRADLAAALGLDPARPIALTYLGRDGLAGVEWDRERMPADWQFISYAPPPGSEGIIARVPNELMPHADATASVDAVVAKAGYGMCGEVIAAGTPFFYPPRPQFAESVAIDDLMLRWGGGMKIPARDFRELRWGPYLERAGELRGRMKAMRTDGAEACAEAIADACG